MVCSGARRGSSSENEEWPSDLFLWSPLCSSTASWLHPYSEATISVRWPLRTTVAPDSPLWNPVTASSSCSFRSWDESSPPYYHQPEISSTCYCWDNYSLVHSPAWPFCDPYPSWTLMHIQVKVRILWPNRYVLSCQLDNNRSCEPQRMEKFLAISVKLIINTSYQV